MKKIQKKTILKPKEESEYQKQDSKQINSKKEYKIKNEPINKIHIQEKQKPTTTKIIINNPIVQKKDTKKVYNYTENQIQKKYSDNLAQKKISENQIQNKYSDIQLQKKYSKPTYEIQIQNKIKEEGYLDSDLEDSENRKIYSNVIQKMENKAIFKNYEITNYTNKRKSKPYTLNEPITNDNKNIIIKTKDISNNNVDNQRKHKYHLSSNTVENNNKEKFQNKINYTEKYKNKINDKNNNNNEKNQYKINDKNNNNNNNEKNQYKVNDKNINNNEKYQYKVNNKNNNEKNSYTINDKNNNKNTSGYKYTINKENKENKKNKTNIIVTNRSNFHKDNKNKDNQNKENNEETCKIRRQTVVRGGKYNNVQVRHIIYSKKNIDFHIADTVESNTSNFKSKYSANIGSSNMNRKDSNGSIKISWKSSVDNIVVTPKVKKPNAGKVTVYYHCSDIKQKDSDKTVNSEISKGIYQTRKGTNIASIPRSKYNTQTYNYKTDKKDNNTKQFINDDTNKNNQINNNYNKNIANHSNSGNIQIFNTPIKAFNNNYRSNNSSSISNNTRYSNYNQNNNNIIKEEQNKDPKNTNYNNIISPKNLANQTKPIFYQNRDNYNIKYNKDDSKNIKYTHDTKDLNNNNKKKIIPIEISKEFEENQKPKNLKTNIKPNDKKYDVNQNTTIPQIEKTKKKNIINKDLENRFILRHYFKIFKNIVKKENDKNISEYEKWFKRNCDNNNDVSKNNIINKYLYFIPLINKERDITEQMPYDEWFNRNCEKSENVIKKQNQEKENKLLFNKLQNILNKNDKNNNNLNKELKKYDNEKQKEILKNLRNSTNNIKKIEKIDNLIDKCDKQQKEDEKSKLIKSAKDKETKQKLENLINLWENDNLPKNEKEIKFEKLNKLFRNNKKDELIEELNTLEKDDKNDAIDYLKSKNLSKYAEIDKLKTLSDKEKKIDVLINILGGKSKNKQSKKEKLKKIVDILLNLDTKTKKDFVGYMKNTAEKDEKKNDDLLSIINELPSEEREEYDKFDNDKNNYSYSYSTSFDKNLEITSRQNTEEIKEISDKYYNIPKDNNNMKPFIDENDDFQLLDDDIFDIVNEIQNTEENPKKKLSDDEFNDAANNIIINLYDNNLNYNDFTENDEEIKTIINSLNNMNKEDRIKTFDILKQNANDESKKKILSKLKNRMKVVLNTKKFIKKVINVEKEKNKNEDFDADGFLDDLESENTIYLNKSNNNISNLTNKNSEEGKHDNNILKSMDENEQNEPEKNTNFEHYFKSTKIINKIKNLRRSDKIGLSNKNNNFKSAVLNDDKNIESIDEQKLNSIIRNFERDLYEEKEKPLTRKEKRENEDEENEKIKEISKIINKMNIDDQNKVLNKLKFKANNYYKKSIFERLNKLIKKIKNVKSYVRKKTKFENDIKSVINIDDNKKEISKDELDEIIDNLVDYILNDNLDNIKNPDDSEEENLAEIIGCLNQNQQNQILNTIKSRINNKNNEEKFNKFLKKLDYINKMRKLAMSLNIEKSTSGSVINNNKVDKSEKKEEKEKDENENENKIELNEEDLVLLIEAILKYLFYKTKNEKNMNNLYLNPTEEYLLRKEKEKKLENTANLLNKLDKKNKEIISGTLTYILDSDDQIKELNKLNKKIGISDDNKEEDNIINIMKDFKNINNIEEINDDKLAEFTEELISDILKDYFLDDNKEKIQKLNKAANTIVMMKNKDQDKILETLNNFAKTDNQIETMEKLNRLVENINYMKFYLYNVNLQHLEEDNKFNKDLNEADLKNFKTSLISKVLDEEEEIKYELKKNTPKNQNENLNDLKLDKNSLAIKSVEQINENFKKYNVAKIFKSMLGRKKNPKKNSFGDKEIKELADNVNDVLAKDKTKINCNCTEKYLFNEHKKRKIDYFTKSIVLLNEENKRKTLNYLTKNIINDNQKKEINKLTESIMKTKTSNEEKNININPLGDQYYIDSFKNIELNEDELNLLIETFCKDLFSEDIQDINKKEENMNLIANIIKELNDNNQNKVFDNLMEKPEAIDKIELIENLREKTLELNVLKDELMEKKIDKHLIDPNKSVVFNNNEEEDSQDQLEESEESITVEISLDDIGQDEIKELCQVFEVSYENDKINNKKPNITKSINILAKSMAKIDNKAQKFLTEKMEENCKNEIEKEQFKLLRERLEQLNTYKRFGKEIIQKKKEEKKVFEEEIKNIEQQNDNGNKNLEEEKMDKLEKEIINEIYSNKEIKFDKNEGIKNYLVEAEIEEKIKKCAEKIDCLSIKDKNKMLNKLKKEANNDLQKEIFDKLYKLIKDWEKIKELNNKVKTKEKQIELKESIIFNINTNLSSDNLEIMIKDIEKKLFNECTNNFIKQNIYCKIAEKIVELKENNQDYILNKLKKKAEDDKEKQNSLKQLTILLDKLRKLKKFKQKVNEMHINKIALEKLENEKKYGIFIINDEKIDDKTGRILIKKPEELNEDKLNEITNILIEDLTKINEEENNNSDISGIDKYLKEKENEKLLEKIADVLNSLDNYDKFKIVEEIKNKFDKPKMNNLYNKFIKILTKKERQFDNEKRRKQKMAIKEIEKDNDNDLLYSIIKETKNNSVIEFDNIGEENIHDNNEQNSSFKIWTHKKGRLETEEIY